MKVETGKELLTLLAEGFTATDIAAKTGIKKRTVEKYLETLRLAYGAKNAPHLIAITIRQNVIT